MNAVNEALGLAKNDSVLHEFRALVLFAQGQYRDAATAIHSVLAVGPDPAVGIDDVSVQTAVAADVSPQADPAIAVVHDVVDELNVVPGADVDAPHRAQQVARRFGTGVGAHARLRKVLGSDHFQPHDDDMPAGIVVPRLQPAVDDHVLVAVGSHGDRRFGRLQQRALDQELLGEDVFPERLAVLVAGGFG